MLIEPPDIMNAVKTLSTTPDWVERNASNWLSLSLPLDMEGVSIQGLNLRANTLKHEPDKNVTFVIEYTPRRRNYVGGCIARIDWRTFHTHNNRGIGPAALRHIEQNGSHHHRFDLNWAHSEGRVRRGFVDIAVPINPDPPDFADLLAFVEKEFRITNLSAIPKPPWEELLI